MRINNLTINNFKCFSEDAQIEFGKITLLTGANSSGKSSFLYSLLGLLQSDESPTLFSPNGSYVNMGDYKEIIHGHNVGLNFSINVTCEASDIKQIYTEWTIDKTNNQPKLYNLFVENKDYVLRATLNHNDKYQVSLKYDQKDVKKQELLQTVYNIMFQICAEDAPDKLKACFDEFKSPHLEAEFEINDLHKLSAFTRTKGKTKLSQLLQLLINEFDNYKSSVNYISSFRLQPERTNIEVNNKKLRIDVNGNGYLDQILLWYTKDKEVFNSLKRILRKIGLLYDIKAKRLTGGRYEINVKTSNNGVFASLCDVGFGIPQVLPIIVADMQLGFNSTLFMSQPEIHLHPSIQALLGDYFVEQCNNLNKMYVIETHSEYLLNRIRLNIVQGKISPEDVKIFHIAKVDNKSKIFKLDFTKDGQILNAPSDFFETYMVDVMNIAIESTR